MTDRPAVFALPGFGALLRPAHAGAEAGAFAVERFAGGELHVQLATPAARRHCIVVGSVAPPETRLVELLLLCDTLTRHGASRVQVVLPYLAYARQDRLEEGASLAVAWLGGALGAAGVSDVVTVDAHSSAALRLLGCPVRSLPSTRVLAAALSEYDVGGRAVVVAPDGGAIERAEALASALGCTWAWIHKTRTADRIEHGALTGELRRTAIVIDDILDTGATLVSCCRLLARNGVEEFFVAVTHGLFTGEGWRALLTFTPVIHVTDTVPFAADRAAGAVRVHSVAEVLEEAVVTPADAPIIRA